MAGLIVVAVNRMPAAEVEVSAELVRRLLAGQHPDLARLPVEFLANGWDNELYRVGDGLVARLPRRALGAEIIKNEQRWLPGLAPRLPLPIPYPERIGEPGRGYPYSWSVVPYLPGTPAAEASFDPATAAVAVGGFLGALHVPAPADAPANPFRGVPLADRQGSFAANLALLAGPDGVDRDVAPARAPRQLLVGLPGGRRPRGRRPAGAGQRVGAELRDRVPGPLRRQPGTAGSRPPHPQRRAGGSAPASVRPLRPGSVVWVIRHRTLRWGCRIA
jgi:hypothetical protein